MKKKLDHPIASAWLCDFGLCRWAEPTRKQLIAKRPCKKPSPEAKPRQVRLVPEMDYRAMRKAWRESR